MVRRNPPDWSIATHALAGLALGIVTGLFNRHVNVTIHKKFPRDCALVTGLSLTIQFCVIVGVLIVAATYLPFMSPNDLGSGVTGFVFTNLYVMGQVHLISEIGKFVDGRFDNLERYGMARE